MFPSKAIHREPFRVIGIYMRTFRRWAMPELHATRMAGSNVLGDAQLVQLARQRDGAAFRTIMQRHNRRLYRMARSVVLNDSEAEDVVQEAYVRAFINLDQFRGESSLATWLSRIVLNEALGRLRHRRPIVDLGTIENQPPSQIIPFPTPQLDPERTMAQRQIQSLVEQAIDELPEGFRIVLVARIIEEMSVEETAELFGLRAETVKTRLHRARALLKDALKQHVDPALTDAFPFAGQRCARMTGAVLLRFSLPI
jgi:RNA polymerase sigma-70 factor, ECF subfamily